jgi:lysophospholipase L1-like esterase
MMKLLFGITFLFLFGIVQQSSACPDIDGLVDIQCDGKVLVVTFGDSITQGFLDPARLGYPGRLSRLLKNIEVANLGLRGENSYDGKLRAQRVLDNFPDADYIIIMEGTNDNFDETPDVKELKDNLIKIISYAKATGAKVLVGNLPATKRPFQREWVSNANVAIASLVNIDFYKLGTKIIGFDGLHPLGIGYEKMAELVKSRLKILSKKIKPKDTDQDGLYDYEESKRRTSRSNPDSDGDGITDGKEVWSFKTNPRAKDTDQDGLNDRDEIKIYFTNPLLTDSDQDGLSDQAEISTYLTNPNSSDSDGDGLTDEYEVNVSFTNPNLAEAFVSESIQP